MLTREKKPIKICLISHFGYPLYNPLCKDYIGIGGAEVQLYLLSKEFARKKNIKVFVITGNFSTSKNTIEKKYNIEIYNVLPIKKRIINYFKGLLSFYLTLIKLNPDIVIQRSASVITGLSALYCRLFKKFFIYSIANEPDVNGSAENGIIGRFFKFGINHATMIIAQTKHQFIELQKNKKRKLLNLIIIRSGYKIVKNFIDHKTYMLWVGRAVSWKNPELFIKLAKEFPSEKFIMILLKTKNIYLWNRIAKIATKIPNLELIDFIPFHKINNIFAKAKIFINTSSFEGYPNTFLQAFKNYTPVISLNVDPDNIMEKNKIGFYCGNDFDKMIHYVRLLLKNSEVYKEFSNNAYLYVKKNHNINKISKEWLLLIKDFFRNHD